MWESMTESYVRLHQGSDVGLCSLKYSKSCYVAKANRILRSSATHGDMFVNSICQLQPMRISDNDHSGAEHSHVGEWIVLEQTAISK